MLYNEEVKKRFLSTLPDSLDGAVMAVMNKISKVEAEMDTNVYDMTFTEALVAIKMMNIRTLSSRNNTLRYLKSYVGWCQESGYCSSPAILGLYPKDIDSVSVYSVMSVKDPSMLRDYMDITLRGLKDDGTDNMYRAAMWFLYLGVSMRDLFSLGRDVVDLNAHTINCFGRIIQIPEDIMPDIAYYVKQNVYVNYVGDRTPYIREKNSLPYLFRLGKLPNNPSSQLKIFIIAHKFGVCNLYYRQVTGRFIALSTKTVYEAGLFYREYQKELSGTPVDYEKLAEDYAQDESAFVTAASRHRLLEAVKTQYAEWKGAFY